MRTFLSANKGATTFWPTDEQLAQMVANAGPLKAQLRAGFPEFSEDDRAKSRCRRCSFRVISRQFT